MEHWLQQHIKTWKGMWRQVESEMFKNENYLRVQKRKENQLGTYVPYNLLVGT